MTVPETAVPFPRYPLLFGPSPVHRLERLSQHLGGAQVWAKREDCNSGIAFGGNKTRKLEYLVADALAQGCDTLVSIGGVQSNHTRQVAAVAARVGLRCVLVQESWVDWPDAVYDKVGNILLSRLAGADVRLVRGRVRHRVQGELGAGDARDRGAAAGSRTRSRPAPPTIASAASASPKWAFEVAEQERELGVFFDTVVVCSVTGSTQAGMIAGFAALQAAGGRPRRVLGIDALGQAEGDPGAGGSHRPQHRRADRRRAATCADDEIVLDERYHAGDLRHPGRADARRHARGRPDRRDDHRPGVRGEVHGRR